MPRAVASAATLAGSAGLQPVTSAMRSSYFARRKGGVRSTVWPIHSNRVGVPAAFAASTKIASVRSIIVK